MIHFDAYQRYETVRQLLNGTAPEPGLRILDAGGYPAPMRQVMPQHEWIVCDPLVNVPGDQVRGSAFHLPFLDDAFDFAVSLDVLEHIEPDHRLRVLDEMQRVSRRGIVLSFPQKMNAVEKAESMVRAAYERWHGKPHPWLSEHAQFDLPRADTVYEYLKRQGGTVKAYPVGALHRWTRLQLLSVLMEAVPDSLEFARDIDTLYEETLFAHEFKDPAYRVIILNVFDDGSNNLELIDTPRFDESVAEMELDRRVSGWLLEHQVRFHQASQAKDDDAGFPLQKTYIEALEAGIRSWEDTYTHALSELRASYAWRDAVERRFSFRLYRRVMKLFGARFTE